MGKFDKEVKEALKIGKGWLDTCDEYEANYVLLKKNNVKWEKDTITQLQTEATSGTGNPQHQMQEINTIRERLADFGKEGKRINDDFDKWALGEPRQSMKFLDKKLKLGGEKSEAYVAVTAGIKNQLTDVATAISRVQRAWKADLAVVLANQETRVDALEKIFTGASSKTRAFLDQLNVAIKSYEDNCKKIALNLKVDVFENDLKDLTSGSMATKDPVVITQKYNLAKERLKVLSSIADQTEKNHGRVLKSVPPGVADQFIASGAKKRLETAHNAITKELTHAGQVFTAVKNTFEKLKLV